MLLAMMTARDEMLVRKARKTDWVLINEYEAETEEGRKALHDIIRSKYLREEYKAGLD